MEKDTGHVTPEVTGHATDELAQAMETAERIVASVDVHNKQSGAATNAELPPPVPPLHERGAARTVTGDARRMDPDEELSYAVQVIVAAVKRRVRALADDLIVFATTSPGRALAIAGAVGLVIGIRARSR